MAKIVQLKDSETGEHIFPIAASSSDAIIVEELEAAINTKADKDHIHDKLEGLANIKTIGNNLVLTADGTLNAVGSGSGDSGSSVDISLLSSMIADAIRADNESKYYVGKIIVDTANINPATYLGFGTWELWGAGKVPVGVDATDADFQTVEKTGGEKSHTLSVTEMPSHTHTVSGTAASAGAHTHSVSGTAASAGAHTHSVSGTAAATGGGAAHNNLQPYITCYMWKRVA